MSTHTAGWKKPETSECWTPATDGTRLSPLGAFIEDCYTGKCDRVRMLDSFALDAALPPAKSEKASSIPDWKSIVAREYAALHALIANAPSAGILAAAGQIGDAGNEEDRPIEDRATEAGGNRSIRLGVAFHEAMEQADLLREDGVPELAQRIAARHRLDASGAKMLESMLRACLGSDIMRRVCAAVRSGKRLFRELPFVRPLDAGTIEEGKIDLLFEDEAGWILVDYKTDWLSGDVDRIEDYFRNKYTAQIREYAEALRAISINVESAYLLLARTGAAIPII